ncbi:response regulator [Nguyenibacter vanlangensis]|uniref:Response regulator n=1 Tax=Nguyenibacter vanlangensis TaxID=1216886 RepID=A0ABZ3D8Q6_9PROT
MGNIGLGAKRRTLLLIDTDATARGALRDALEQAGFSVGEAADSREGLRTTRRVRPDAILADLMLETADAGAHLAETLRNEGLAIPLFIISTASQSLSGTTGFHELGISGVFLKPVDAPIVIQALRSRLSAS